PVNDAPVAVDDVAETDEDTPVTIAVLANDTDVDGDALTVTSAVAANGTVVINADGTITYTPNADFNGTDTISYEISDGQGGTATATVTVTVNPVNDAPVAVDDVFTAAAGAPASVVGNALGNDVDPDGDDLTVTAVNGDPALLGVPVAGSTGGLFTVNPDGSVSFDPNGEFDVLAPGEASTTTVSYTISDGQGGIATAIITVTVTGINLDPVATDDVFTVGEDAAPAAVGNVITGDTGAGPDSDIDGGTLTVAEVNGDAVNVGVPVAGSNGGLFTVNPDGTVTFDPNGDFESLAVGQTATTTITYTISDGQGGTSTATITVTIEGANDAPVANPDTGTVTEDVTLTVAAADGLLANDTDVDGDALSISGYTIAGIPGVQPVGAPVSMLGVGVITINADGSYSFAPAPNYNGPVPVITYTVTDGNGGNASSTLTLTITPVNDAPVATDDIVPTRFNSPVSGNVLNNDSDVDGDPLSVSVFEVDGTVYSAGDTATMAGVGTLFISPDGTFVFTPVTGYTGPVPVVTYTVSDGALSASARLILGDVPGTTVLPEESADSAFRFDWISSPGATSPVIGPLPIATEPALHVLYAVGSSSAERALAGSALGGFQTSAPLRGEALGQVPDALLFDSAGQGNGPALIRELGRGEVQTIRHALHVQHAVRHVAVTAEDGLFVQKAVRASQLESAVRNAVLDAHQSATPGFDTLLDPFGLGSPRPVVAAETAVLADSSPVMASAEVPSAAPTGEAAEAMAEGVDNTSVAADAADAVQQAEAGLRASAQGFRTQLQRMAADRSTGLRPLTRAATPI
ncbi:MAG TPA: Ig-like domain-containing protein, partial [Hydrogenophaga sp.]